MDNYRVLKVFLITAIVAVWAARDELHVESKSCVMFIIFFYSSI